MIGTDDVDGNNDDLLDFAICELILIKLEQQENFCGFYS